MKYHVLGVLWVFVLLPHWSNASVIEFAPDGSIIRHEAVDYRSKGVSPKLDSQKLLGLAKKYELYIERASKAFGVDQVLILAVIAAESDFNANAVSPKGAMGLMQLMPATANDLGVKDPFDPEENIFAGVGHLKTLLDMNAGDERLALAAYNAGQGAVDQYKGVPPYAETLAYIRKIETIRKIM